MTVDVGKCARCGEDHPALQFVELLNHERYQWWATCPKTGQPVLMRIVEIPEVPPEHVAT